MTHASIPAAARAELGLSDTLIRLSPGCENSKDLVNDLLEGLEEVAQQRSLHKAVAVGGK
jgi:cystathionine beta-lyase/cystathionine gamma-synthase